MRCPCGLGPSLDDCCGRFLSGAADAPTAERLMRSRYTAFAVGDVPYLRRTWHPDTLPRHVRVDPKVRWISLEVLATEAGGLMDQEGAVEFVARHEKGQVHERSSFVRHEGRWVYVAGMT